MRRRFSATLLLFFVTTAACGQSAPETTAATNSVQLSSRESAANSAEPQIRELKIPAGTRLDIEATYTVNSRYTRPGDLLSFRVLVPIKVDEVTVIAAQSLVTARVAKAKRGGHWGRAGKLAWTMEDVVAVDLTRVPLTAHPEMPAKVTGTSHGGEVATKAVVFGVLLAPFGSPLALMSGFKRGDDAVLPEGKRFVVYVKADSIVKIPSNVK